MLGEDITPLTGPAPQRYFRWGITESGEQRFPFFGGDGFELPVLAQTERFFKPKTLEMRLGKPKLLGTGKYREETLSRSGRWQIE